MNNLCLKLKKSYLFKDIDLEILEKILKTLKYKIVYLEKKEILFDAFANINYIALLLDGKISIEKLLPSGKSVIIQTKNPGEIFGEVAAFSNTTQYPCNTIAKEKSTIILWTRDSFFQLIKSNENILKNFLTLISNKTYFLNLKVECLSFSLAKERVAYSLINEFEINKNSLIVLPFSKSTWADNLNISRASLYKELEVLLKDSIIEIIDSKTIKIIDFNKLYEIIR